jgi:hypothetical protein
MNNRLSVGTGCFWPGKRRCSSGSRHDLPDAGFSGGRDGTETPRRMFLDQVSVRREASHIHALAFGLLKAGRGNEADTVGRSLP